MLKITAYRCVRGKFTDSTAQKQLSNATGAVYNATNHILKSFSTNLTAVSEERFSKIATEPKSCKPWYPGTIPDPDSPDYEEFEKSWIEGCKMVAEDIKNKQLIAETVKARKGQDAPTIPHFFKYYTPSTSRAPKKTD